jgi:hypothetical protein
MGGFEAGKQKKGRARAIKRDVFRWMKGTQPERNGRVDVLLRKRGLRHREALGTKGLKEASRETM